MSVPSTPFFFFGGRGGAAPTSGINASVGLIVVRRMTNKNRALLLVETQSRGAQHNSMHNVAYCSGCVVECRICNREVADSNLGLQYFAPRSTQPSVPPGSVSK